MAPRAYDANATRLLRRSTPVYDADDIRRNIRLCMEEGRPCVLEHAADIPIDRGFIVPGALPSFAIDGGDRYRLIVTDDVDYLFLLQGGESTTAGGGPVDLANLTVILKDGVTVADAFIVRQAFAVTGLQTKSLTLRRVTIDGADGTISNVFRLGAEGLGRVVVDGLTVSGVVNMFAAGSNLTSWLWCRFSDVLVEGVGLAEATWGLGSTSPAFIECIFQRIAGSLRVDTGSFSAQNFWCVVTSNGVGDFITNNPAGGRPQTLLRVSNFAARTLSPDDVDLD